MSEQETPEELEAAAEQEVRRADADLEALEQRVLADDPEVGPEEIEQARSRRYFAGLRADAIRRKAAQLREKRRAGQRQAALEEARRILAEVTDEDVEAAVQAAGDAMARVRQVVRARNDARRRALRVLQECPAVDRVDPQVGRMRGVPSPTYPELGHGVAGGLPVLWVDGRPLPEVDEAAAMDRARRLPAEREWAERQQAQAAGREARIERDAELYRRDPAAFRRLPAARRAPVLERLGVNGQQYAQGGGNGALTAAQGA